MGLTYNGIDLSYVLTERVSQESSRDPSGTDQLYTTFRVDVRAVVAPNVNPANGSEAPGLTVARVRHMLLQPRQSLTYVTPDGAVLVAADGTTDAANGPFPLHCTVSQVTAGSFMVEYSVECRLTDCGAAGDRQYLSLRWSEAVSIDEMWRTVKTRNGTLIVKGGVDADSLRGLVTPGVSKGFRRELARYELNETNLQIRFTFTDREMMRPPPAPAIRCRGRQVESTPMPGAIRHGELSLRLEGPKGVSPRELLNAAIRIGVSRANASGVLVGPGGRMLIGGSVAESLNDDENAVELSLRWKMKPVAQRNAGRGLSEGSMQSMPNSFLQGIGNGGLPVFPPPPPPQPNAQGRETGALPIGYASWVGAPLPGSDPLRAIGGVGRGTAPDIRLIAAALNDPCGQTAVINELHGGNFWAGFSADGAQVQVLSTTAPGYGPPYYQGQADDSQALYSDSSPGVYEHYTLTAIYRDSGGNCVLPSTKAGEKGAEVRVCNSQLSMRLEWSASRTGGPPVWPSVSPPDKSNVVYVGGTIPVEHVDVGGDGVSLLYSASGIFDFEFLDASIVAIAAPVPPWLALGAAANEPNSVFGQAQWPFKGSGGANPFTGQGVSLTGGGSGGGGPPVLP